MKNITKILLLIFLFPIIIITELVRISKKY